MFARLTFSPDASSDEVAARIRGAWPKSKVIHLEGLRPAGDLRDFYMRLFSDVGVPLRLAEDASIKDRNSQRTGEVWFEVRYDPAFTDAYRHSANAQPLHTDGSYIPNFPNAGFLACQAMPETGGATVFIDAADVVSALRKEAPDLLSQLETSVVPHSRSGDCREEPVIRYEAAEPLVNWNYYCVAPDAEAPLKSLADEFFKFLQHSPSIRSGTIRVKLSPGEAVLWKDDRVLHGRDAFDPEKPSDRFLWKAAIQVIP